ncbi:UNVERIFIED_CONTAM: hypothetical protein PYX00_008446 [Menopon gallinae]|uniref:Alanyl-transfer RNA synthetases family profile domain-containing protein n=1 Tax=Menopon gallinae TaxID=328185 RepID=A0AAW2HNS0_9NEOP
MVFACQNDSFQRTLMSRVVSCTKVDNEDGYYEIICEDSILFPEGGGQPYDKGFINGIPVHQVLRRGDEAVMYVKEPVKVGEEVRQEIDWERRLDHMQQHSGQHLITAVINATYKFETTSWWLGEKVSHIELDTPKITEAQIQDIENLVNQKIQEQIPVKVKLYDAGDKALEGARTRGLPNDVSGPIRVVEIVGLEDDMCCGTHVNNLIQLQCIKLLYAEKGKKHKTNLFFICGGRVLKTLTECLQREKKMTKLLKNEPASHCELVEKLQTNLKSANKKLTAAHKELAIYDAMRFKAMQPRPLYHCHYNKDADSIYIECYLRTLKEEGLIDKAFFVLAAGGDSESGFLVVHGNPSIVKDLGPKLAEVLVGRGVTHGFKFQAKVSKLSNFPKVEEMVKEYFEGKY